MPLIYTVAVAGVIDTFSTCIVLTVTTHCAVYPPSVVVTVIVVVPSETPVTIPVESTVAFESSLLLHVTLLLVALSGAIVGVSWIVPFTETLAVDSNDTPVTATLATSVFLKSLTVVALLESATNEPLL